MSDPDFPPNSRASRGGESDAPKKVERVTTAEAKRRKKPLRKQLSETLIGGDPKAAAQTMVMGVLIPALKDAVVDAATRGFETLIFGEARRRPSGPRPGGVANYVNYATRSAVARRDDRPPNPMLSRRSRAQFEFEELAIQSRAEAEEVITKLFDLLDQYDSVSVADLYELTGVKAAHTDQKWGWTDLRGANARRMRDGTYLLDLPEPEPLN